MCKCGGVSVSMCDAKWGEGGNTVPPPSSHHSPSIFPISIAWPLCFCVMHWQACVPWEDPPLQPPPVPPPSPSLDSFFLSWRLPPLSPTSPSDLTDLTGPSLSLSLPLLAAPLHSLALLFFLDFPPLKFVIFVLLVPCWPFSCVYLSSLVGLLFPPSKKLFSSPYPPLRSSREPQTLRFSKFILLLQARLAPPWHVVLLILKY